MSAKTRLPALAVTWLLLAVAALAALSCSPGDGSPTALAHTAVPTAGLLPTKEAVPPSEAPTEPLASATPRTTARQPATMTAGPTAGLPQPSAAPAASPTTELVRYACPPEILPGGTPVFRYKVVAAYPHDPGAFTQGLVYTDSTLYESTGLYVASSLRRVELETGKVLQKYVVPTTYFAEGMAVHGDRIVQLTWREGTGFIYDRNSFDQGPVSSFTYPTEGWGLTHDGTRFIMSDGTATLYFRDLETLDEIGRVPVHDTHGPVACLNELEYIDGRVYANVWQTDYVAVIDPATGVITTWIDLAGLLESMGPVTSADVLNGIAYDVEGDRLFVTGKWWPWLFEIELVGPLQQSHLPQVSG